MPRDGTGMKKRENCISKKYIKSEVLERKKSLSPASKKYILRRVYVPRFCLYLYLGESER